MLPLALLAALVAQPPAVPATTAPVAPAAAPVPADLVEVRLETSDGPILLALDKKHAPITTANFLRYVDGHRLDGTSFYRAVRVQPGFGLIQAGVRDPRKLFPPIPHEPTSRTGLLHTTGTISMARGAPGSAAGDFFITVGDLRSMDADASQPGDNLGFAAFGHVVSGMEVVTKILDQPTSPTLGGAAMKGQMLLAPVRIISAKRVG